MRWYGGRPLVRSFGGRFEYDKVIGDKWTVAGTLLVRRNDYAQRNDVDGLDVDARAAANRPLGPTTLGFGYLSVQRNWAKDPGEAFWRGQLEIGILKEIGWGLRPRLSIDFARQVNQAPLAPFGRVRRDWLFEGSFSIYKRDWNLQGFAPSFRPTATRNLSSLTLYEEKRVRAEIRLTKAF